jgi:hypothetical protein
MDTRCEFDRFGVQEPRAEKPVANMLPAEISMNFHQHPIAQRIEYWPIDKLVFYARNPRKNDTAVDRMCSSIREFGFKIPVLARSDGEVVDGHLRLKAARKLGITEIPVILCDEWSPAQVLVVATSSPAHDQAP